MEEKVIATSQLGIKCKSKKEVYQLMATQGRVYMPPIKLSNHDYVAGIIEGSVKVRRNSNNLFFLVYKTDSVKVIQVPQINGLSIEDIISFAKRK